jgi:hypothetical protein
MLTDEEIKEAVKRIGICDCGHCFPRFDNAVQVVKSVAARSRTEAIEEAAKAECDLCEDGYPAIYFAERQRVGEWGGVLVESGWQHQMGEVEIPCLPCKAGAVRSLAAPQMQEGER